jgi:hypothetical protein
MNQAVSDEDPPAFPSAIRAATLARLAPAIAHDVGNTLGAARLRLQVLARELGAGTPTGAHVEALRRVLDDADAALEPMRSLANDAREGVEATSVAEALAAAVRMTRSAWRVAGPSAPLEVEIADSVAALPRVLVGMRTLTGVLTDLLVAAAFGRAEGSLRRAVGAATLADAVTLTLEGAGDLAAVTADADGHLRRFEGAAHRDGSVVRLSLRAAVLA